jgi:hypothetical protein
MPRPVLTTDRSIAANLKNKTKHCNIILPGQNLSTNIKKRHVRVERTDGVLVTVTSGKAVQGAAGWVLVVKTNEIPRRFHYGDSEEVTVTVTNPDTGETSDPTDPPVEVVYVEEE